jgi:hypothetical protein
MVSTGLSALKAERRKNKLKRTASLFFIFVEIYFIVVQTYGLFI